jgi:GTP-binding protein Era
MFRSGFVAIAGQPNVGKSTILNGFLRDKLAIVTPRPETTRDNIRGIYTDPSSQIIFTDTPGIHKPHDLLGKLMVTRAQSSILESDLVLFITERPKIFNSEDELIRDRLPQDKPVILVINKADRIKNKKILLPLIEKAGDFFPFSEVFPMSALDPSDLSRLLSLVKTHIPEGPELYPKDQLTDKSERFMIQETIREKVLGLTFEEVPHSIAVSLDNIEEQKDIINIYATIYVERTSQKSIIIGKGGNMIKEIGSEARKELASYFGTKVYLDLWVKVYVKWKKDVNALRELGYTD